MRGLLKTFDKTWQTLLGLALPTTCPACAMVLPGQPDLALCPGCYGQLPWWDTSRVMPPTLPSGLASFTAPLLYDGPARTLIHNFKFHDQPHLAPLLIRLAAANLPTFHPAAPPLLVPVPLHPSRLRKRFYNQSLLLARALHRHTSYPLAIDALQRRVPAEISQSAKTRAQRLALPGSHFQATDAVKGKTILLIDDIYTTGATARACALALRRAGAGPVHVFTLAYTPPG